MTQAPPNLLTVRSLLLQYLDLHPGTSSVSSDLDPTEVGIVGDPSHRGGYHCGSDRVVANDYSVVESPRDRAGLTIYASALDVGWFEVATAGGPQTLRTFSSWCVTQCRADTPDSRDIREIIYSLDGVTVHRWDRLGLRSTGDSTHLYHTHFSFFRDATKANRDLRPLFVRYLTDIGLIRPPPEADMQQSDKLLYDTGYDARTVGHVLADLENLRNWLVTPVGGSGLVGPPEDGSPAMLLLAMAQAYPRLTAQVSQLAGKDFTDEPAIIAGVLAGLSPAAIAAAIPPTIAQQVVDELAARLAAGSGRTVAPGIVPPPR
ncbi:hypothetical protein ACFFWC_26480 [Plantactinospora siamensis]|uniref:Uncharacterized protein n=1 Tax=Plantactinospora siamensis TaxID=555372 RepID=A0ABV6NZ84_9ACTN